MKLAAISPHLLADTEPAGPDLTLAADSWAISCEPGRRLMVLVGRDGASQCPASQVHRALLGMWAVLYTHEEGP